MKTPKRRRFSFFKAKIGAFLKNLCNSRKFYNKR